MAMEKILFFANLHPAEDLQDVHWKIYLLEKLQHGKIKKHYLTALFKNCIKQHPIITQSVLSLRYFK